MTFQKRSAASSLCTGSTTPPYAVLNEELSTEFMRGAGVPFSRLHDAMGPYGGTQIFYRLGITIDWAKKKYRTFPPEDSLKWAKICEGIIRHYNEGWADGFHYGIQYWEIWNEPENPPMWSGSKEEFFELYRVASKYLKGKFPECKIGGYGSCGFYAVTRDEMSDFHKGFITYFHDFLKMVTAENLPLDFFSWYIYTNDPQEVLRHGEYVRRTLDGGFRFEFTYFPWGCRYYLENGEMMPKDGISRLSEFDAIYLGAVGYPGVPDHISLWDLLLTIRYEFDQYVNLRPVKLLRGAPCPLRDVKREDIDMLVIRENSEGEYAGEGNWLFRGKPNEVVLQTGVFSRKGTERIIRYAYETARHEGKKLTSISKGNALNYSMVFWDSIFAEVGREYPDVRTDSLLVDAASMFCVSEICTYLLDVKRIYAEFV